MNKMISFYKSELIRFSENLGTNSNLQIEKFINTDTTKISWNRGLKMTLANRKS
jgi:predicted helicase